ncbi:N-acetyltransferase family protein [Streptomyces sp. NPDC004838]
MEDTVIRRAEITDARVLAVLRRRFKQEEEEGETAAAEAAEPSLNQDDDEDGFVTECEQWLRTRLAGPWRVWLAEADGRPCGHVFLCLVEKVPSPFPGPDALGYVTNFYVPPERRNQGVGRALLDEATRYARVRGLDTLIVWPSDRSAPLYRRCGFGPSGELLERPVTPG